MKTTSNIRTKIIAATFAALTIMSAMSVMSSAADMTSLETPVAGTYGEHAKTEYNHDIAPINPEYTRLEDETINSELEKLGFNEATEEGKSKAEETIEAIAKGFLDGGLDILGDAFPGGKLLSGVLGALFGQLDDSEDPTAILAEQEQQHFEELRDKIDTLNSNMEKYTEKLALVVKTDSSKRTLGQLFTELSTNLKNLTDKIQSINDVKSYTPEQKLVLIANLNYEKNEKNYLTAVRDAADAINKALRPTGGVFEASGNLLADDLYGTLVNLCRGDAIFQGQAYDQAMATARALTEQYMYANTILLECQNVSRNLNFTEDQIKAFSNDKVAAEAYEYCTRPENINFQTIKAEDTMKRLRNGFDSFLNFDSNKKQNNRYIGKGAEKEETVLDFYSENYQYITGDNLDKMYNKDQFFKGSEINDFINYIRKETGGNKSIADYLRDNGQKIYTVKKIGAINNHNSSTGVGEKHCYIVVDPKITRKEKLTKTESGRCAYDMGTSWYDVAEVIKVVDIYDLECKVQEIVMRTWVKQVNGFTETKQNITDHPHNFLTIGSHKATENDDIKPKQYTANGLEIKGPEPTIIKLEGGPKIK